MIIWPEPCNNCCVCFSRCLLACDTYPATPLRPFSQESCYLGKSDRYRPVTRHQKNMFVQVKGGDSNHLVFLGNSYATELFPGYLDVVDAFAVG